MKKLEKQWAVKAILNQHDWIVECGGNEDGYRRKYGTAEHPIGHGDGGSAIFAADYDYLRRLIEYAAGLRETPFATKSVDKVSFARLS